MDVPQHVQMLQEQEAAPVLVEKVAEEEDVDDLAEVCATLEAHLREECQYRDLSRHAGIAACYLVANRLANPEDDD